ncbi:MAG: pyruvate kinase [Candidatus Micrarchaeota archaeon]|nr:pyruvate kinase [Candidatus Micrarchaeota archaeon]MDE1834430.1 pyruvate kinase [Candidatus Micrarchaeota archaeon]MDE1859679.1 pyruvate kinase [Candidatus Micrarchaeota archaeon]
MKTKIVATYGPSIDSRQALSRAMKYVDIFRINFSHGDKQIWLGYVEKIRKVSKEHKKEVALLADLPGPKMRLGKFPDKIVARADIIRLKYQSKDPAILPLDYDITPYLRKGSILSIGDGYMNLRVDSLSNGTVTCAALNSGTLQQRKGINIRHGDAGAASPTPEDMELAKFAKKNEFDLIALSFIQSANDIDRFRKRIGDANVVAKIERAHAVADINNIAEVSDVIMIARGDLAFEIQIEKLPTIQLQLIHAARRHYKPVIVATQMLASMVNSTMPTRAEVNDIATAVASGADCIMLSEESAIGKYPIEALKTLAATAKNAEGMRAVTPVFRVKSVNDSIAFAAAEIADNYKTDCIFVPTQTGASAIKLSVLHPKTDIIALSGFDHVRRRLNAYGGITSENIGKYTNADQMFELVKQIAKRKGLRKYIVVSGYPNQKGTTNTLRYID